MNLQDFLSGLNQNKNNGGADGVGDEEENTFRVTFYQDRATSDKIDLYDLPASVRDFIDSAAARILDMDNRHSIVVGHPLSGKSFILEQIVYNIEHYTKKRVDGNLAFISINDVDMLNLGNITNIKKLASVVKQNLEVSDDNICFVTESADAATYLSTILPECRVILEINMETFKKLLYTSSKSSSKLWHSWQVIDVDQVYCTKNELIELLQISVLNRVNANFENKLTKRQVTSYINYCVKIMPDVIQHYDAENKDVVIIPPGVWATILRYIAADYNYNTNTSYYKKDGSVDFNKIMKRTIDSWSELFGQFDPNADDDDDEDGNDLPAALLDLINSEGGKVINISGQMLEKKEPVEVTPMVFKDVSHLEERLNESILGQKEAIKKVADGIIVPAAGLNDPHKPLRSYLFLGSTGIGKTALSLKLAEELSDTPLNVVRIDMSEYQQPHEVAKLFGAPPGYVGYENGGILTSAVENNPHSLILLDEIEKANPKVWDTFLQVLDSGRMTDSNGNVVDFTQTVIIMTSNLGVKEALRTKAGFANHNHIIGATKSDNKETHSIIMKELENNFRPEMINRIDEKIIFDSLNEETAREIVKREIAIITERIKAKGYDLEDPTEDVVDVILSMSDITKYGAREIQRVVFSNISNPVARFIVNNNKAKKLALETKNNEIIITKKD